MTVRHLIAILACSCVACATTGSGWISEAWDPAHPIEDDDSPERVPVQRSQAPLRHSLASQSIGVYDPAARDRANGSEQSIAPFPDGTRPRIAVDRAPLEGKVLGKFKNTYYDFPSESDYSGETVQLFDGQCRAKGSVPKAFFESLCVQGSGLLASGNSVSFNRRDCDCAPVCSRTGQRICFDVLDIAKFPWGRGATGQPITPLLTVAVDSKIVPLGTSLYIPEYDGLPRDLERGTKHDGCFLAQDRGLRVQGEHVDIFTGRAAMTRLWNSLVPTNSGVTVVLDSPRCSRAQ